MPQNLMVRGRNILSAIQPYNFTVPATPVIREGNDLYLPPTTVYNPFPGTVNYGSLVIIWDFSFDGGSSWYQAGRSENELYVTLDTPQVAPVWHTPIHISAPASAIAAAATSATVIVETMKEFAKRTLNTHHINPLNDAKPLTYYQQWNTTNGTMETILADPNLDGQCGAFANLFSATLRSLGVTNAILGRRIGPKVNDEIMLINSWEWTGDGTSSTATYPYQNTLAEPRDGFKPGLAGVGGAAEMVGERSRSWHGGPREW